MDLVQLRRFERVVIWGVTSNWSGKVVVKGRVSKEDHNIFV